MVFLTDDFFAITTIWIRGKDSGNIGEFKNWRIGEYRFNWMEEFYDGLCEIFCQFVPRNFTTC